MPRDTEVGALTRAAQIMSRSTRREAARVQVLIASANNRHEDLALVDAIALLEVIEHQLVAFEHSTQGDTQ